MSETKSQATVAIHYRLSVAGVKASVLAGGSIAREQVVHVQADDPLFSRAVGLAGTVRGGMLAVECDGFAHGIGSQEWDRVPSVIELLDWEQAREHAAQKSREDAARKSREETQRVLDARVTRLQADKVYHRIEDADVGCATIQIPLPAWPWRPDVDVLASPGAVAWLAELAEATARAREAGALAAQADAERLRRERLERERLDADRVQAEADRRAALGLTPEQVDYRIDGAVLMEAPLWGSHKRDNNWLAHIALDPTAPGGLARTFWTKARGEGLYLLPELNPGDALECASDYTTGGGHKTRSRWYGFFVRRDESYLVLQTCDTGPDAVRRGKAFAQARRGEVSNG